MPHVDIRLDYEHCFHAPLSGERTNLGSGGWAQGVHVSIPHASVAELHASIEAIEGGYKLVDRSGGRTSARDRPVASEITLIDGLSFKLGEVSLTFHEGGADGEPRTAADPLGQRETLPGRLWLTVREPGSRTPPRRVAVPKEGALVLGASAGAHVLLPHPTVSGEHARLWRETGRLRLEDAASRNGTLVNQVPIERCTLPLGAAVRIGPFELQVTAEEEEAAAPAALEELHGIFTAHDSVRKLFPLLARIAEDRCPVVVFGETGTGKEGVAQALHALGPRAGAAFVAVNCGAIPEGLVDSHLFGHVKGAFTGAVSDEPGCFRRADGGTIFLDELGELPPAVQPKLLRVLQEGEVQPVGASKVERVDVRVVAATHRDLRKEMAEGRFRADLYYRLVVAVLELPPLRERGEDAVLLFERFFRLANPEYLVPAVTEAAKARLRAHRWPGNIRELQNVARRARLKAGRSATLGPEGLSFDPLGPPGPASAADDSDAIRPLGLSLRDIERAVLAIVLRQNAGSQRAAALQLGISRTTLVKKLREYGLAKA
ncbi:MAG: sigma 54-interacting transcriptional regulator [Myxococcales bacterium]